MPTPKRRSATHSTSPQPPSISPTGEAFPLPTPEDYRREFGRLRRLAEQNRKAGREIVVVVGLGFVGAVMAAVVADATDKQTGRPNKFVIGMQRPSTRSYWKIPLLNRGVSPVKAEDPEVDLLIGRCVKETKTLVATYTEEALKLADVVVVDVQCDYLKESLGNVRTGAADMAALEASMAHDRREHPRRGTGPDRDHRRARHDRAGGLSDHEEDLRASAASPPSRCSPTATNASCRAATT